MSSGELGDSVGVLTGSVHGYDASLGAGCQVEVVITCAGTYDNLQLGSGCDHFLGHLVGADDKGVSIGYSCVELLYIGIFLESCKLVAAFLDDLADLVNGYL